MQKSFQKLLSLMLAFALAFGLLPVSLWQIRATAADDGIYVLDATADLAPMDSGTKADGDTDKVGTEGYFTLTYAAKTKIDSSSKTFADGYEGKQRINFQSATDPSKGMYPGVGFTTAAAATVKLWWVSGGDGRQFAIFDNTGAIIAQTEEASVKNSLYISELTVEAAGSYFLGVPQGSNYLFKMEVAEAAGEANTEYTFTASADLTATADKEAIAEGALTADGYFSVVGSVTKRTEKDGVTVKSVELGKNETGAISFTVVGSAQVVIEVSSTGSSNTSTVAIFNAAGEAVSNKEGITEVTTTSKTTLTYSLDSGTYRILSPESGYGRGVRVYTIQVVQGGAAPARNSWASVAAPVVSTVVASGNMLNVTVDMPIGEEGADSLIVSLLNAEGEELRSSTITTPGESHELGFSPATSGEYFIRAVATRVDEADKPSTEDYKVSFTLPLAVPSVLLIHNEENGGLTAMWSQSKEADAYEVSCTAADGTVITETVTARQHTFTGLTVGESYSIQVIAIRGQERTAASAPAAATASAEAKLDWNFVRYGESTNDANNGYSVNEDGTVTVWSEAGKGKIQPASTDGLAFYYTAVPTTHNFTLRALVTVDGWKMSNAQEGFGLLATDRLGNHGSSSAFWNNQYMLGLTKVEYRWDSDAEMILPLTSQDGIKFSMRLGMGALAKTGLTPESLAYALTMPEGFVAEQYPMDRYAPEKAIGGGNYNIVGNAESAVEGTLVELTQFIMEIQKNNTGYFLTYYDTDGNIICQKKYYEADALNALDSDFVYVGFFASRNVRATYEVLEWRTIECAQDAPAEKKPVEKIEPVMYIISADSAQSTNYELIFTSNVSGTAFIRVNDRDTDLQNITVQAGQWVRIPITVTADGITDISVYMSPDPNQDLGEYKELSSVGTVERTISITHTSRLENQKYLYVSPNGYASGEGTPSKPLDIYTAVKIARPGQIIVLMEGTYLMKDSLKIQRGINGTAENPIVMMADPAAETRPVLDFQRLSAGVVHAGDYWYFLGFDVTNTQNAKKGFQISGNNNVLDNIMAYYNGDTGIQISRLSDLYDLDRSVWPSNNLILNCTSFCNYDAGFENADGFAAKLTCGEGNVFDGCVAYNNADDGWDLYAKVETGAIGAVIVRNSVAYANGFVPGVEGQGNGNGFKLGGSSISGQHQLINCYSFWNLAKGIDSNSCPDIIVENCTSYNNGSHNVALYTNLAHLNTAFVASGIISFKDGTAEGASVAEKLSGQGTQNEAALVNDSCYYWNGSSSKNASGTEFTVDMFASLEFKGIIRNADGTINMQGFLNLAASAPANAGARMNGTPSAVIVVVAPEEPPVDPENPVNPTEPSAPSEPTQPSTPSDPTEPTLPSFPTDPFHPDVPVDAEEPASTALVVMWVILLVIVVGSVAVTLVKKFKK